MVDWYLSHFRQLNCVTAFLLGHLISLILLSQSTLSASHSDGDRFTHLELKNKQQDEEIHFLKVEASENRNAVHQMENKFKELALKIDLTTNNAATIEEANPLSISNQKQHQQNKRPARLLPLQLFNNKIINKTEDEVTVPSSCHDLSKLGHTLNGIYLVKGENSPKVDMVFCNFQPPKTIQSSLSFDLFSAKKKGKRSETAIENRIGYVDVKSASGVYFYAISQNGQVTESGTILFDKMFLNIGNAMNASTGVFTVPKTGIYHFSFSILREGANFVGLFVHLRLNGNRLGVVVSGDGLFASQSSMQSTLKLKKGDRIDVWKAQGAVHEKVNRCNHFTGWLLEEYLEK